MASGGFDAPDYLIAGIGPYFVASADFDEDGDYDLVTTEYNAKKIMVLENISFTCGDANTDRKINGLDITFLINYLYRGGPEPYPCDAGDENGDHVMNILDVTYLINFLYKHGPDPICPYT